MQSTDRKRFGLLVTAMSEIFGKSMSAPALSLYFAALQDLSIEQVEYGVGEVMKNHKYSTIPTPAEIREQIAAPISATATLAWDLVAEAMIITGRGNSLKFTDLVIHSTIESMGGWTTLCQDYNELDARGRQFYRREFERIYVIQAARGEIDRPKYLFGSFDQQNMANGWLDEEKLILKLPSGGEKPVHFDCYQGAAGSKVLLEGSTKSQTIEISVENQ